MGERDVRAMAVITRAMTGVYKDKLSDETTSMYFSPLLSGAW